MANGFHPRVEATIDATLRAEGAALWLSAWVAAVSKHVFVPRALELFAPDTITFAPEWATLDDVTERRTRIRTIGLREHAIEEVLARRDRLDADLAANGMQPERQGRLRRFLPPLIDRLIADPRTDTATCGILPAAWRFLADAVAASAHQRRVRLGERLEDWRALNERLVAAFLVSSNLDRASLVEAALTRMSDGPLGVRGRLVRLVEESADAGVQDVQPPPPPAVAGRQLAHHHVSALLAATADAWSSTIAGQGFMHRFLDVNARPAALPPAVSFADLVAARSIAYQQHEYTVVTYLALASAEQLLRGAAQRAGIPHATEPVMEWIDAIQPTPRLRDAVDALYARDRGNIRNRFMHGGLLDIESKRMEQVVTVTGQRPVANLPDPYLPRNIAQLCFAALETIDDEVSRAGPLTAANFVWTAGIDLQADETAFGSALPFDFARPDGVELQQQMSDFLTAITPAASQLFRVGFVGWLRRTNRDTLPMFVAMLIVFEALVRMVEHLCGLPVLQWDDRNGRCLYAMFDDRGLASPDARRRVLDELAVSERGPVARTIELAMKVRNAFAHGAIVLPTSAYLDAAGHIIVKASLAFMLAAEQHLIREAAYFQYRGADRGEFENWLIAERRILATIRDGARARR